MKENYRGTGKTKAECQALVDEAIARFKKEHPGKPVPVALERWVENIADEADVAMARKRMHR
jgi:hypothetical protein